VNDILKIALKKQDMIMHTAFIRQMGRISGGLLWELQRTFGTITLGIFLTSFDNVSFSRYVVLRELLG
jgi:hypothetical protein